jgi:hypothetical protein
MSNGSTWGTQLARAQARARKKFPNQPERARQMQDEELAIYNPPYNLEQLTLWQKIKGLFEQR